MKSRSDALPANCSRTAFADLASRRVQQDGKIHFTARVFMGAAYGPFDDHLLLELAWQMISCSYHVDVSK